MATHHGAHHTRSITIPLPGWTVRGMRRRLRRFEQKCARHWAFAAYAALSLAVAGYVIATLVTI